MKGFNKNHLFEMRVCVKRCSNIPQESLRPKPTETHEKHIKSEEIGNGHTLAFIKTICFNATKNDPKQSGTFSFVAKNTSHIDVVLGVVFFMAA